MRNSKTLELFESFKNEYKKINESKEYIIQGASGQRILYNNEDDLKFLADAIIDGIEDYGQMDIEEIASYLRDEGRDINSEDGQGPNYLMTDGDNEFYVSYLNEADMESLLDELIDLLLQYVDEDEVLDILQNNEMGLEIIDESEKLDKSNNKQLYVYSDANSYDKEEVEGNIYNYRQEAPELRFKPHKEGEIYFVDFIGSKEDIINYLVKLGWYRPEEIEKLDLIKPYNIKESVKESEESNKEREVLTDFTNKISKVLSDDPNYPSVTTIGYDKIKFKNHKTGDKEFIFTLNTNLDESEKLNEKRNPENDEANELIRNSLNDPEFAKTHAQELRKHGIKYLKPSEDWGDNGALEGKEGRRLAINTDPKWEKDNIDYSTGRYMNDRATYQNNYSRDDTYADKTDLHQKTYKDSKERVKDAKSKIKRQETKVKNMEAKDKEAGLKWNEKTYNARQKLNDYKSTIENGIRGNYKDTDKIHPDTDLKGFLNSKKHSDRPLPREKDPKYKRYGGKVADPANKDVEDYKANQQEKKSIDRDRAENARYTQEDKDRIEAMKQRAKEDKVRRDSYINKRQKEANKVDNRINKKLNDYRQRMNK